MDFLTGHTTPETAYVVEDYPYGFRLRCKIRYWLEFNAKHGFRFVSQTTDPRRSTEVWNKPKPSTYAFAPACMLLMDANEKGIREVTWTAVRPYDLGEFEDGLAKYAPGLTDDINKGLIEGFRKAFAARIARKLGAQQ